MLASLKGIRKGNGLSNYFKGRSFVGSRHHPHPKIHLFLLVLGIGEIYYSCGYYAGKGIEASEVEMAWESMCMCGILIAGEELETSLVSALLY